MQVTNMGIEIIKRVFPNLWKIRLEKPVNSYEAFISTGHHQILYIYMGI